MTHNNSDGKNAIRLNIVRADQEPEQLLGHNRAPWPNNYFSLVWTSPTQACLYVHDEVKPGGYRIACTGDMEPYSVVDFELNGNNLTLTDSEGTSWTVNLSKYLDDTYVDQFYVDGDELVIGQTGTRPTLRLSLTALLAPLVANVVEAPAGRFSFYRGGVLIEQWWQGGFTTKDEDGNVTITNPDGTTVEIPFQELATYAIQFTANGKVEFLINGVVDKVWQQGAQVDQLANGLYRATNFAGNIVTWYGLKDATLASIDEAAGTVTIQNPDGSLITFGIGNADMQLVDASVADGILTIEKVGGDTVIHRQTRVTQGGVHSGVFTANHRTTWANVEWRMPYVERPSADVAIINIYDHAAETWSQIPIVTPEDVVILNNPVIYIRESTGSANPPITEQADLTVANAFNNFNSVRTFMERTLTVGKVTLDVRGTFDNGIGNIGPAEFKNTQKIEVRGNAAAVGDFVVTAGHAGGRGATITGGSVVFKDFTINFVDVAEKPQGADPFFVSAGSLVVEGSVRITGFYDTNRVDAGDADLIGIAAGGARLGLDDGVQITVNMANGTAMNNGMIALAGGQITVARDITFNLQNAPDYESAFINLQAGSNMRSVITAGSPPIFGGTGRSVAPCTILVNSLAIARIGGFYGGQTAVKAYDWGVDTAAGGPQAVMNIDAIGVLNNIAGP